MAHIMTGMPTFESFANMLDYPENRPGPAVVDCISSLGFNSTEAVSLLRDFQQAQDSMAIGQLQEIYAGTFDMKPDCSLYMGYQMFGDDWRRSRFLADLAGRYRACRFPVGKELPDHVCLILRFLAVEGDGGEQAPLIQDCLVPGLTRVLHGIDKGTNPYGLVLEALLIWLKSLSEDRPAVAGVPDVRS